MNATRRTSLVALLAIIPLAVMTGCSTSTPGTANPAAGTASPATASVSPSPTAPDNVTMTPPPAESTTTPPSAPEPSPQDPAPNGTAAQPTDLNGEVYGFIRGVDVARSELTLDKVDWFWGADAEHACAVDSVPDEAHLDGWCSVYYFRNVNPRLRVVSVSPNAAITTLEGTTPVSGDLQALADRTGTPGGEYHPYRIIVTDGAIVEITQIYQP